MSTEPLAFFRSLPEENIDDVRGNAPPENKMLILKILRHTVNEKIFATEIGKRMKITDINVYPGPRGSMDAQMVFEIDVTKDMCNSWRTMHGACAAYFLDLVASGPIIAAGIALGRDLSGMSTSMGLVFHRAPKIGDHLKMIGTTIAVKNTRGASRVEIIDKHDGTVYVSGTLNTTPVPPQANEKVYTKL